MQLSTPAFTDAATIPTQHTADGVNISPSLQWSGAPGNTRSFALVCEDPDAPRGTWIHWVLFILPPDAVSLPEDVPTDAALPSGARHGKNDFGKLGYGGPAPPKGPAHRYYFKLFALDAILELPAGATRAQLEAAMKGHLLASAQCMGKYQRT
jgi:Raf kinase inhibitor-like YbhB/YbcL family protein